MKTKFWKPFFIILSIVSGIAIFIAAKFIHKKYAEINLQEF